jgi:type II secretory pathway pseudopilin PulG
MNPSHPNLDFPLRAKLKSRAAFSLIELLLTVGIAALVLSTAVIVYAAVISARSNKDAEIALNLGTELAGQFYDLAEGTVQVWSAPNYGRTAKAEELRELLLEDAGRANAVFVLSRPTHDSLRPTTLDLTGTDPSLIDTPNAFLTLLNAHFPEQTNLHTPYRGPTPDPNLSIFLLEPSPSADFLAILAIYEIDLVEVASPAGTYASVRRYVGGTLTAYYDIFYPEAESTAAFAPLAVCFEKRSRLAADEGDAVNAFKQAADRPFYFLWWPDPAARSITESPNALALPASDPRSAYLQMGQRTSFFLVLPMFPPL